MSSKPVRVGIAGENDLDPLDIYYTHSKIRPFFSGCGKRIVDTIAEIESGQITANDLPQISVIQDGEGHTFCLNNRRLYVFKHLRRMGLLTNNTISVRVKKAIPREMAKYSPEKCSLNCVLIREKAAWDLDKDKNKDKEKEKGDDEVTAEKESGAETDGTTTTTPAFSASTTSETVATASGAGGGGGGGVAFKNNKKKLQSVTDETDEERYIRQKQKITAAKELYEKQAAERRQRKAEKEALQRTSGGGGDENDSESEEDDDDEGDDEEDLFICNLCR